MFFVWYLFDGCLAQVTGCAWLGHVPWVIPFVLSIPSFVAAILLAAYVTLFSIASMFDSATRRRWW